MFSTTLSIASLHLFDEFIVNLILFRREYFANFYLHRIPHNSDSLPVSFADCIELRSEGIHERIDDLSLLFIEMKLLDKSFPRMSLCFLSVERSLDREKSAADVAASSKSDNEYDDEKAKVYSLGFHICSNII
jgi:regulator of replication initiation timing